MLLFLHGEDTFRSTLKLKEMIGEAEKKDGRGLNIFYIDAEEDSFEKLRDSLKSRTIFNDRKLLVVKNAFKNSSFKKAVLKNKNLLKRGDIIVFHERGRVKKSDKLYKLLSKEKAQEFKPLKKAQIKKWGKKLAGRHQARIDSRAAALLAARCGTDLWRLNNEIAKMAAWKNASKENNAVIEAQDVEQLTRARLENDIFKTIEAIANKDKGTALNKLRSHLDEGDSPFYLLSMISWQFTRLLAIKEKEERGEDPYQLSWHPYVIKKSRRLTGKFEFEALKDIHTGIKKMDVKMKTGRVEPEMGLELLISSILVTSN